MIDAQGFRLNVAIILLSPQKKVFLARRLGKKNAWQFPQGGMREGETPREAMFRELKEELGLSEEHVEVLSESQYWLKYYLPRRMRRYYSKPLCIGQKQKWFLLALKASEQAIHLDYADKPEFDRWQWVDYWYPLKRVIHFKKGVYRAALKEFEPLLSKVWN